MTAEVGRDEAEVGQARGEPPEDRCRACHAVERDHGVTEARTELVHVQPHAAIMGQRRTAGR
jgi:hypothetical protein